VIKIAPAKPDHLFLYYLSITPFWFSHSQFIIYCF